MYPALRIPMQNTHLSAPYESSSLATPYSGGTMGAGQWCQSEFMAAEARKPYNRASPGENKPTALTGDGNAPLLPTAPPPEGEVLAPLCLEMLMSSEAESRANFPLRGKYRRRRG